MTHLSLVEVLWTKQQIQQTVQQIRTQDLIGKLKISELKSILRGWVAQYVEINEFRNILQAPSNAS